MARIRLVEHAPGAPGLRWLGLGPHLKPTRGLLKLRRLLDKHAFWAHPQVTVTPHIASETRPPSASRVIAENIRRSEAGEPLLNLVDRARGY